MCNAQLNITIFVLMSIIITNILDRNTYNYKKDNNKIDYDALYKQNDKRYCYCT